jgi:hypothetical protein
MMASEAKAKSGKESKGDKGDKGAKPAKPEKKKGKESAEAAAPAPPAPPSPPPKPRAPVDPRLKLLKKFHGRFLPKGVLRQRHEAIMGRWNSGDDHGGVTVDELRKLLDDWRGTREKPPRVPTA